MAAIIAWLLIAIFSGFIGGLCVVVFMLSIERQFEHGLDLADHDASQLTKGSETANHEGPDR